MCDRYVCILQTFYLFDFPFPLDLLNLEYFPQFGQFSAIWTVPFSFWNKIRSDLQAP